MASVVEAEMNWCHTFECHWWYYIANRKAKVTLEAIVGQMENYHCLLGEICKWIWMHKHSNFQFVWMQHRFGRVSFSLLWRGSRYSNQCGTQINITTWLAEFNRALLRPHDQKLPTQKCFVDLFRPEADGVAKILGGLDSSNPHNSVGVQMHSGGVQNIHTKADYKCGGVYNSYTQTYYDCTQNIVKERQEKHISWRGNAKLKAKSLRL